MLRRLLGALAALLLLAAIALAYLWNDRADLSEYDELLAEPWNGWPAVTATWLGVSTVLISDGETHLLTDGFFTRPGLAALLRGEISPRLDRIAEGIELAGVDRIAAVLVLHSHYDHAMDAPEVALRTDGLLVGSPSTEQVGLGWGMPASRIVIPEPGVPLDFGDFAVTFIESQHLPHGMAMGTIDQPLEPPASPFDYKVGKTYILHIKHPRGSLAIAGSAGFVPGMLADYRADTVLLGIGGLGSMDESYRADYLREVLGALRPSNVLPIHYDDFTRPLSQPIAAMPTFLDDVETAMADLQAAATTSSFALRMFPLGEPVAVVE